MLLRSRLKIPREIKNPSAISIIANIFLSTTRNKSTKRMVTAYQDAIWVFFVTLWIHCLQKQLHVVLGLTLEIKIEKLSGKYSYISICASLHEIPPLNLRCPPSREEEMPNGPMIRLFVCVYLCSHGLLSIGVKS